MSHILWTIFFFFFFIARGRAHSNYIVMRDFYTSPWWEEAAAADCEVVTRLPSVLLQGNRTLCESQIHKQSSVKKKKNKVDTVRAGRKRDSFGRQFRKKFKLKEKPVESSRIDCIIINICAASSSDSFFKDIKRKLLQGWMGSHGGATSGDIVFLFTNRIQFVIPVIVIGWKNLLVASVTVSPTRTGSRLLGRLLDRRQRQKSATETDGLAVGRSTGHTPTLLSVLFLLAGGPSTDDDDTFATRRDVHFSTGWPHRLFPPLRCANNIRLLPPPVPPSFWCPVTPGTFFSQQVCVGAKNSLKSYESTDWR